MAAKKSTKKAAKNVETEPVAPEVVPDAISEVAEPVVIDPFGKARELLVESMRIHNSARPGPKGRPSDWKDRMAAAAALRMEAWKYDRRMSIDEWKDHKGFMDFYRSIGVAQ